MSFDRKQIVYVEANSSTIAKALLVSAIDNPQPRIICERPNCGPSVPFFTSGDREIIFWGKDAQDKPTDFWRVPVAGGEPRLFRKVEWTMDGPAFHPTSGEIIIGAGKYNSQISVRRIAIPVSK